METIRGRCCCCRNRLVLWRTRVMAQVIVIDVVPIVVVTWTGITIATDTILFVMGQMDGRDMVLMGMLRMVLWLLLLLLMVLMCLLLIVVMKTVMVLLLLMSVIAQLLGWWLWWLRPLKMQLMRMITTTVNRARNWGHVLLRFDFDFQGTQQWRRQRLHQVIIAGLQFHLTSGRRRRNAIHVESSWSWLRIRRGGS